MFFQKIKDKQKSQITISRISSISCQTSSTEKNPVVEALEAGQSINKIYISSGPKNLIDKKIIQLARQNDVPVREVDRRKMFELARNEKS